MPKDPDILVDLTTARTDFEAEVIVQALEGQGIPARAFTTAGAMLQWEVAMTQPMRIAVRRRDLDAARSALRAIRADSVDIDWDEIDTGAAGAAEELPDQPAPVGRLLFWGFVALVAVLALCGLFLSLQPS
jgi:hypothetical protein